MSLETLLEAARYVEQQEQRAKQLRAVAVTSPVSPIVTSPIALPIPQATVVALPTIHQEIVPQAQNHTPLIQQQPTAEKQVQEILKFSPVITTPETNGYDKSHISSTVPDDLPREDKKSSRLNNVPGNLRSGTREVHNKLEKNRRAHLKECFEMLKRQLPPQQDEKKTSNLSILHSALRYIQLLKKKERENEHEMERLAREKIAAQQRLASLKKELGVQWDNIEYNNLISDQQAPPQQSTPIINVSNTTPVQVSIKEEHPQVTTVAVTTRANDDITVVPRVTNTPAIQSTQLNLTVPFSQVVTQGLVVGLHKVALVSKPLPLVSSPVAHILTTQPQLNGKVVPLMNAQYLMKPVVVVSTPSAASTALSPRPS